MSKKLVIVESPTKARTISKFLSKDFIVASSMGHIRDLPSSASEIPAKYKKEKWANLGVNVENGFEPLYVIPSTKKKVVKDLKAKMKEVDELILATDEDREGEAISWHLLEILKPKVPVKRMVFHEITKEAIEEALSNFRDIDQDLVNAQETRRILDRLAGYTLSPLLWKKIAPKLSAGRVQSVAVALLVERERQRMRFKKADYYGVKAELAAHGQNFFAEMTTLDKWKVAIGKDFERETGELKDATKVLHMKQEVAEALAKDLKPKDFKVTEVDEREQKKSPPIPFITSTLQQEGNKRLRMSASETMSVAQKLYEKGYITYMRTDSPNLSQQAITAAQKSITDMYGNDFLAAKSRQFKAKSKSAQEAHEAIRPAGIVFRSPEKSGLTGKELELYDLIYRRTLATQMADAVIAYSAINFEVECEVDGYKVAGFKASGKVIRFPGYLKAYDTETAGGKKGALNETILPPLKVEEAVEAKKVLAESHETKPPARYTEAALIKALESQGVGRPSTYASIISTVQRRGYVDKAGTALVPTFTAFAVTQLLETNFQDLVDVKFTASMEEALDDIAAGKIDWLKYMDGFFLGKKGLQTQVAEAADIIEPKKARILDLPHLKEASVEVHVGRYGPYVKNKTVDESATIPEGVYPGDITEEDLVELLKLNAQGPENEGLGKDPETGFTIYLKTGRYGPYVQLGEEDDYGEKDKPKRAALLKGMEIKDMDIALALKLLELPRLIGEHPEDKKDVRASVGRFGPYVVHDGQFASIPATENVLEIELKMALELLATAKKSGKGKKVESKVLGQDPKTKEDISLRTGRYGPYLKCGKLNVAIPKGTDSEKLDLKTAIELVKKKRG